MKYARLVLRNLSRNLRRTTLTIFAIALAVFTYATLSGLPYIVSHLASGPASARRIVAMNKSGFFYSLPAAYRRKIQAVPHVEAVSAMSYFGGVYQSPSDQLGSAVDADAAPALWPDWGIAGSTAEQFQRVRTACLVPAAMMRKYRWKIGQRIILKGTAYPVDADLIIVGTLGEHAPPDALIFRRDYLDELLGAVGRVNVYFAMVDREDSIPAVTATIDETFANSSAETTSTSETGWMASVFDFRTLLLILSTVAAAVVVAMSLIALNTMVMAMRERRSEIAVMRAVGFGPGLIVALTLCESTAIGLVGGVAGCVTAFAMAKLIPGSMLPLGPVDLFAILPPAVLARAMTLAVLIGVVAGSIPAASFARRGIVESICAVG